MAESRVVGPGAQAMVGVRERSVVTHTPFFRVSIYLVRAKAIACSGGKHVFVGAGTL
jgi:hypothetical protein